MGRATMAASLDRRQVPWNRDFHGERGLLAAIAVPASVCGRAPVRIQRHRAHAMPQASPDVSRPEGWVPARVMPTPSPGPSRSPSLARALLGGEGLLAVP